MAKAGHGPCAESSPSATTSAFNHIDLQNSSASEYKLPMDLDKTSTSNTQGNELDTTSSDSAFRSAPSWLDSGSSTMNSNVSSAVSGATGQPLIESPVQQPLNEKVAIPRVSNPEIPTSNKRTSRACDACHEQKVKCSGHRPACQRCREGDIICIYTGRKREREAKFCGPISQKLIDA